MANSLDKTISYIDNLAKERKAVMHIPRFPREHYEYGHEPLVLDNHGNTIPITTCSCQPMSVETKPSYARRVMAWSELRDFYYHDSEDIRNKAGQALGYSSKRIAIHNFLMRKGWPCFWV